MENNFASALFSAGNNEKSAVAASCPNCGAKLEFGARDRSVICYYCDSMFSPEQLVNAPSAKTGSLSGTAFAGSIAQLIDSPDAGVVYIQNHFDNVDWDAYCESTEILLPEIEEMVEKSKIKFGATASAWLLDFESVAYPLTKKLEGLRTIATKMAEHYSDVDLASIMDQYDLYKAITETIVDAKKGLLKRLDNAVSYANKLGLEENSLSIMQTSLLKIHTLLDPMEYVKTLTDIPELNEVQKRINEQKVREFASRGLAVRDIYDDACRMSMDPGANKDEMLRMFESIRGYADVNDRIAAINRYYDFNGEYYHFCGRSFVFKARRVEATFDPNAKDKGGKNNAADNNAEDNYSGYVFSLYEVVDCVPAKEPVLEDITRILAVYANRLYYIKRGRAICYYDIQADRHYEIDKGNVGDYNCDKIYYNATRTAFYIRKKLPLVLLKKGCLKKLFSKKDEALERSNNYSVLMVNLLQEEPARTVIRELVDVTEFHSNTLFYTQADEEEARALAAKKNAQNNAKNGAPVDEEEEQLKLSFRAYNILTEEDREVLSDDCEIHTVVESYVVFSKYAPNAYNKDLYVYDIESGYETLIENNVLDYFDVMKDRIFYTVGNDNYCPLFSNNFFGTDRVEIMQNVEKIVATRAGWMYVIKGHGRNTILVKISSDGKRRLLACTQFQRAIKITDTHIYYLDTSNALRVARTDGKENILIANDISATNVIVDKDAIYYIREELVDNKQMQASLYRMDTDGHNVRKLIFNVSAIDNFDSETIMLIREEPKVLFEITTPISAKESKVEREEHDLKHFCKYDKNTGEVEVLLTLGMPREGEFEFKKGCIGKKMETLNSTVKRIPRPTTYKRKNVAAAGAVFGAQTEEQGVGSVNTLPNQGSGCNQFVKK